MRRRVKIRFLLTLAAAFLCFVAPVGVQGKEVQEVETDGSVQFTGIYVPIGKPEPTPPEGVEKPPSGGVNRPDGSLPKTNMIGEMHLYWLGTGILFFVILLWRRRKKENDETETPQKNTRKVGIIT